MDYRKLAQEITDGRRLTRDDTFTHFITGDLNAICAGADIITKALCGRHIDLCTIVNGRSGRCGEDCKFCAQSGHHCTGIEEYAFMDADTLLADCKANAEAGVHRYSIVTAGRTLAGKDFETAIAAYQRMSKEIPISLCASHGLLTQEQFDALHESGVRRYHSNLETSKRFFPEICTTHTYEDKIENIKRADKAGLQVCSGGIIGMGETWEDRIDMAVSLSELPVVSIPINALIPIQGTPLFGTEQITEADILRTVAIFRYINPTADIRLAAGRSIMAESGKAAFCSGANAAITGNMLTTSGNNIREDFAMLAELGADTTKGI